MTMFLRSSAQAVSQHSSMKPMAQTSDPGGPGRMGCITLLPSQVQALVPATGTEFTVRSSMIAKI